MDKDSAHQQSVPATSPVQQAQGVSGEVAREEVDVAPIVPPLGSESVLNTEEHHAHPLQEHTDNVSLPAPSRPTPEGTHEPTPTVSAVSSSSQSAERHAPGSSATVSEHPTAPIPVQIVSGADFPSHVRLQPPVTVIVGSIDSDSSDGGQTDAQIPSVEAGSEPVVPEVTNTLPSTQPHLEPAATLIASSSSLAEQHALGSVIVSGHMTAPSPFQGTSGASSLPHARAEYIATVNTGNGEASSSSRAQRDTQIPVVEASNGLESSSPVHVASRVNSPSHARSEPPPVMNTGGNEPGSSSRGQTDVYSPTVRANSNSGSSSSVVPEVINILPHTQPPILLPERPAGTDNSGNSSPTSQRYVQPTARPSSISIPPAPPSIHSVYYSPHQSIIYALDPSGAAIPLTASPLGTPPISQYIPVAAPLSRQGSPVSFIQTINGQPMLVQPLGPAPEHSVLQSAASLSRTSQSAAPALSAPVPAVQFAQRQPIRRVSPPTFEPPIPGPSGSPRSEDIPPAVPPKPPALVHAASVSAGGSTRRGGGGGGMIFPTAGPMTTSSSDPPRLRTLSFNAPPRTDRPRRPENIPLTTYNGPPLTDIGSGPYPPPHASTPWDNVRNGNGNRINGDGDYFEGYQSDHPSMRRGSRSSPQTPNRTYSPGSEHRRLGYEPRYRSSQVRIRNGHSNVYMGDPNDRGENGILSRRGSRISSSNGATLNNELQDPGVGGGGDDDDGVPGGFRRMINWIRGKPKKKKKASDVADQLGVQERDKTIAERLAPTLIHAEDALRKARSDANVTGWSLNIAIGLQVLLGALTTGVAAATSGRHTSIAVTILGGLSTLAASYLAKARGSGEPEASVLRCSELENFVRELQNLSIDMGAKKGGGEHHDTVVQNFRDRFEKIMGSPSGGLMGDFVREKMADSRRHLEEQVKVRGELVGVGVGGVGGVGGTGERDDERDGDGEGQGRHQQQQQQQHDDTRDRHQQQQQQQQQQQSQHQQPQQSQQQEHQQTRNKGKDPQRSKE